MPYDVDNDPYLDPTSGVLRNLLGIATQSELDNAETIITSSKITTLLVESNCKPQDFDARLLLDVHKEMFSALYDWAGDLRTIEISKGTTSFASSLSHR